LALALENVYTFGMSSLAGRSKKFRVLNHVDVKRIAEDRVYRRDVANRFARGTDVDPGDLEHVLYNLTLPPLERLARGLS
jgi:hypothetical protein